MEQGGGIAWALEVGGPGRLGDNTIGHREAAIRPSTGVKYRGGKCSTSSNIQQAAANADSIHILVIARWHCSTLHGDYSRHYTSAR